MPNTIHPSWLRLVKLPPNVIPCPRCSSPRHHNEHNWRWDEEAGSWLCTRPFCMEQLEKTTDISIWQRKYAPVPQ